MISIEIEPDIAWAAGFIDGEGCISVRKAMYGQKLCYYPNLAVTQVSRRPLEKLQEMFGGSLRARKPPTDPHHQQAYEYNLQGDALKRLLVETLPMLLVKDRDARIAMTYFGVNK